MHNVSGFYLVPTILAETDVELYMEMLISLARQHQEDLPSPETMQQELNSWYWKYKNNGNADLPDSLSAAYKAAEASINYPNILYLLKLMLTIPATSASTERANSTLKFIKTRLRSTLSQKSLNAFVLGYKHRDILNSLDACALAQAFISMKRRRLLISNPLAE